ncbi:hypothetical protein KFK09_017650 [Dendrobium nobile]|uniref:DUF4283 domain-containing protein n=1 Tax=Dendrobium nobile TaxID=94219 RepID=A0A8T3B1V4_DENNO|nr:hypothetical protein KFK09_017650 [Dendrobium nobile]
MPATIADGKATDGFDSSHLILPCRFARSGNLVIREPTIPKMTSPVLVPGNCGSSEIPSIQIIKDSSSTVCENFNSVPILASKHAVLDSGKEIMGSNPWSKQSHLKIDPTVVANYLTEDGMKVKLFEPNVKANSDRLHLSIVDGCCARSMKKDTMENVITGGPWFVNGHIIGMDRWSLDCSPSSLKGLSSPVWVRLPNLPLFGWDEVNVARIASLIGIPLLIDGNMFQWSKREFGRVCVRLELDKQLPLGVWVEAKVVNEGIDNVDAKILKETNELEVNPKGSLYGPWIHVNNKKKRWNNLQRNKNVNSKFVPTNNKQKSIRKEVQEEILVADLQIPEKIQLVVVDNLAGPCFQKLGDFVSSEVDPVKLTHIGFSFPSSNKFELLGEIEEEIGEEIVIEKHISVKSDIEEGEFVNTVSNEEFVVEKENSITPHVLDSREVDSIGGIVVMWRSDLASYSLNIANEQCVIGKLYIANKGSWIISTVYGSIDVYSKRNLWDCLGSHSSLELPYVIGGDFNCILSQEDKRGVKNENGNMVTEQAAFEQTFLRFFSQKWKERDCIISGWPNKLETLSKENVSLLGADYTLEEVEKVIFSLGSNISPGIDGIPYSFMKAYWKLISQDIWKAISHFISTGKMNAKWKETLVVLIPKVCTTSRGRFFVSLVLKEERVYILLLPWTLRAKYGSNICSGVRKQSCSVTWRILLNGLNSLRPLMKWKVATGASIDTLDDVWILNRSISKWPTFINVMVEEFPKLDFFIKDGEWNQIELRKYFGLELMKLILQVQIEKGNDIDSRELMYRFSWKSMAALARTYYGAILVYFSWKSRNNVTHGGNELETGFLAAKILTKPELQEFLETVKEDFFFAFGIKCVHWDIGYLELMAIRALKFFHNNWNYEAKGIIVESDNHNVIKYLQSSMNKVHYKEEEVEDLSFLKDIVNQISFEGSVRVSLDLGLNNGENGGKPDQDPMIPSSRINGSLARRAIKDLMARGSIRMVSAHFAQQIYTRATNT